MIEDLLNTRKISAEQYEVFQLFELSEAGREYLKRKVHETFMEMPPIPAQPQSELFVYLDGRRSVFREIIADIKFVQHILREATNV